VEPLCVDHGKSESDSADILDEVVEAAAQAVDKDCSSWTALTVCIKTDCFGWLVEPRFLVVLDLGDFAVVPCRTMTVVGGESGLALSLFEMSGAGLLLVERMEDVSVTTPNSACEYVALFTLLVALVASL
jgi:hypothetical protein